MYGDDGGVWVLSVGAVLLPPLTHCLKGGRFVVCGAIREVKAVIKPNNIHSNCPTNLFTGYIKLQEIFKS